MVKTGGSNAKPYDLEGKGGAVRCPTCVNGGYRELFEILGLAIPANFRPTIVAEADVCRECGYLALSRKEKEDHTPQYGKISDDIQVCPQCGAKTPNGTNATPATARRCLDTALRQSDEG